LATIAIGKNIDEPENSNTAAITYRKYQIYTDTHFSTTKTTLFINTHIHPDPRRTYKPLFVFKNRISWKVLHLRAQ
jgi:hypothetical protein